MKFKKFVCSIIISFFMLQAASVFGDDNPVATDSRIRTYVYGENEVFKIVTKYGYQSNVEFAKNEEIVTLSVGDSIAFRITPAGNRLFVKAMEENRVSNMTVVTNLRAYQFDISSIVEREEDLVYVMRFYYPEKDFDSTTTASLGELDVAPAAPPPPPAVAAALEESYNFNYSLTGPDNIAPVRVFDDGRFTFFKFPNNNALIPQISVVNPDRSESPVAVRDEGEYIVVESVFTQFALRFGPDIVCVFNDDRISPQFNG